RLAQGERIVEVLKQDKSSPVPVEKQVAILYAVVNNILMKVDTTDIAEYEEGLFRHLDQAPDGIAAMKAIRETGKLEADTEEKLKTVLNEYTDQFVKKKG
ncbi:MAG: F0F1 ATP synthase subunit alpha, partial [Lachnospiraceae bacterium]|nr:F0F1 ATP synthase subunit alpha [Lachnospiraceae bacterium]